MRLCKHCPLFFLPFLTPEPLRPAGLQCRGHGSHAGPPARSQKSKITVGHHLPPGVGLQSRAGLGPGAGTRMLPVHRQAPGRGLDGQQGSQILRGQEGEGTAVGAQQAGWSRCPVLEVTVCLIAQTCVLPPDQQQEELLQSASLQRHLQMNSQHPTEGSSSNTLHVFVMSTLRGSSCRLGRIRYSRGSVRLSQFAGEDAGGHLACPGSLELLPHQGGGTTGSWHLDGPWVPLAGLRSSPNPSR